MGTSENNVNAIGNLEAGDIVIVSYFNTYRLGMVDNPKPNPNFHITLGDKFITEINPVFIVGKIGDDSFHHVVGALTKLKRIFREGLVGHPGNPEEYERSLVALAGNVTPISAGDFIVVVEEGGTGETFLELERVVNVDDNEKVEFRGRFRKIEGDPNFKWCYVRPASRVIPIKLPAEIADNWYIE